MPRPYNWVRGEGTVKNQRWGLGSVMDTPFIPGLGEIKITDGSGWNPSGAQFFDWFQPKITPNSDTLTPESIAWGQGWWEGSYASNPGSGGGTSIGEWFKQNQTLLLVGGAVGLLLAMRR